MNRLVGHLASKYGSPYFEGPQRSTHVFRLLTEQVLHDLQILVALLDARFYNFSITFHIVVLRRVDDVFFPLVPWLLLLQLRHVENIIVLVQSEELLPGVIELLEANDLVADGGPWREQLLIQVTRG